jgi:hypothetical protein
VTAGELAEELGASLRTLNRDLGLLRDSGLPIESDRGRGGGLRLKRNWALGRLRPAESLSIHSTGKPAMMRFTFGVFAYLVPTFALGFVWHLVLFEDYYKGARHLSERYHHSLRLPVDADPGGAFRLDL